MPHLLRDQASADQGFASIRHDRSEDHRETRRLSALKRAIDTHIEDRVGGIMTGLRNRLRAFEQRDKFLELDSETLKPEIAQTLGRSKAYSRPRRSHEEEQRLLDALRLRLLQEEVDQTGVGKPTPVQIVEQAEAPFRSRRAGHPLDGALLAIGVVVSLGGFGLRVAGRRTVGSKSEV